MSNAIKQIRRNIRRARALRTQGVNNAQALYERGVGDINYIGAEVGDYLGNMNQRIGAGYDQAGSDMAGARAALQAQMGQTTNANADAASTELSRLGISGSGLGNLRSDANFAQLASAQQGTNEQTNNTSAKANAGAVGELLLGMNQGQRQSALGKLLNARNDDITQTRFQFRQERRDMLAKINDILAAQAAAKRARSSSGGSHYYGHSYGHGSYGGSSSGDMYQKNQDASINLIGLLGKKPKAKPKPTSGGWVNDTMNFLFPGG